MRTTVNLDDDVLVLAKNYAESREVALGKAISQLVRRGLDAPPKTRIVNGLVVFDLPKGGERISSAKVKKLLSEFP